MKGKRFIAFVVLAAFGLFSYACFPFKIYSSKKMNPAEITIEGKNAAIVTVITKTGQVINFRKSVPGRVIPGLTFVSGDVLQDFEFDKKEIANRIQDAKGNLVGVETTDGRTFALAKSSENSEKIYFSAYSRVTIPVSDIQQVWVRKTKMGMVALNVLTYVALASALGSVLHYESEPPPRPPSPESCPFIYSYDGKEFVLDAEPYGSAVTEGFKRTDWIGLSNLREVDGKYRLLLTNELSETDYTDELKLVVVDHDPGVKVAPDLGGQVHTFGRLIPPTGAVDQAGRDVLTFVKENDLVFWLSDVENKDPGGNGDFRDELVFTFPKPAGAKRAKLLANVWTTQWGANSTGTYLEFFGSKLEDAFQELDRHGPLFGRILTWMAAEELFNLKIWVETAGGWMERGMIMGSAPVITKDKTYVLDVGDVPGDVLRIKLRPPVNFWMVNSLAVDYSEDLPVQATEIAAESAVDQTGRDRLAELAATDNIYHVSPNAGERTELVFAAPPLRKGLERTVLVKASGYYKVNLVASGEPRTDLIEKVLEEPGFAARYSFREYLKWAAGLKAEKAETKR